MHLADAFIQSDLHCISSSTFTFLSVRAFPGNRTRDLNIRTSHVQLGNICASTYVGVEIQETSVSGNFAHMRAFGNTRAQ